MFGLHAGPLVSVGALCGIAAAFLIVFARLRDSDATSARLSLLGIFVSILLTLPTYTIPTENRLDKRDEAITAKLLSGGISVIEYTLWDDRVTVQQDGCRATYAIQRETPSHTDTWPLVRGTATTAQGCSNPDDLFIR